MQHITICKNNLCPSFKTCYRAQAKPDDEQAYAYFLFIGDKCDDYIPLDDWRSWVYGTGHNPYE